MGVDDLWYSTMRKPPSATAPFDWKLLLIWPHLVDPIYLRQQFF